MLRGRRDLPDVERLRLRRCEDHDGRHPDRRNSDHAASRRSCVCRPGTAQGCTRDRITDIFEWAAFKAGLPPIRLHDLRHGAASLAHAAGADMKAISHMLGHSSLSITADTYTSVFEEADAELAESMRHVVPRSRAVGDSTRTDAPT